MSTDLANLQSLLFRHLDLTFSTCTKDPECEDYSGQTCVLSSFLVKFRKAKITPKKTGQFVTVWQRNIAGITIPFTSTDPFDFYIIMTEDYNRIGYFIFPRSVLSERGILTTAKKEGKRGFRVYPDWDTPTNKQATQTQQWQSLYFIDCTAMTPQVLEKAKNIIQQFSS